MLYIAVVFESFYFFRESEIKQVTEDTAESAPADVVQGMC
jgi:hypothetical protein